MRSLKIEPGYYNSVKWGGYALGLSFLRQIFLVPVFIITVGNYGYSFWLILSTLAIMLTSLNLGHLHYAANQLNFLYHKDENIEPEMTKIQGATCIYCAVQLLLGLIICYTPVLVFVTSFSNGYLTQHNAAFCFMLLLVGKIFLQYTSMFTLRLFEPIGRINTTLKYQAVGEAADLVVTIGVIYFTGSIFYTCLAVFITNVVFSTGVTLYVAKNVPYRLLIFKRFSFKTSGQLIRASVLMNSSFLVEKMYDVGLNLVVVRVFGPGAVALFNTSRVLTNIFYRLCTIMVIPLFPVIQKQYALNYKEAIVDKMKVFWSILPGVIILAVTIGMPFLPYVYNLWTSNELQFNVNVIGFLFMAVSFQNFVMIISEFLKKTNLSRQILIFNVLKSVCTIAALTLFGAFNFLAGLGIALFFAEFLASLYCMVVLLSVLKNEITAGVLFKYLVPVMLFCLSILLYLYTKNYWLFLLLNVSIIAFFTIKNDTFKNLKKLM